VIGVVMVVMRRMEQQTRGQSGLRTKREVLF
jgi:hypothetical protein